MLWNRSLIMYDLETKTLWSHILGEAMHGPLKGAKLELLSSSLLTWRSWRKMYPITKVSSLSKSKRNFDKNFYKNLSKFVLGVSFRGNAKAWSYEYLSKNKVAVDDWQGDSIVILFDDKNVKAKVFKRKFKDQLLSFSFKSGVLVDKETGTSWDIDTGKATSGKHKGEFLTPVLAIPSYKKAWLQFHSESEVK
jgi:hypothetical protein